MTHQTDLALFKAQLNLLPDDTADDAILAHKLATAEQWIAHHTGKDFDSTNALMTEAALQLAAYLFEQREAASDIRISEAPFSVLRLLQSVKDQVTGHDQTT